MTIFHIVKASSGAGLGSGLPELGQWVFADCGVQYICVHTNIQPVQVSTGASPGSATKVQEKRHSQLIGGLTNDHFPHC
jgi:hypothetical protein